MVLGASGATGRLVVTQLLKANMEVVAIVRSADRLSIEAAESTQLHIVEAEIAHIGAETLASLMRGCNTVISCLGHNLTFKGIYGQPKKLVTLAAEQVYQAAQLSNSKIKFVLMNTTGNSNRDIVEQVPFSQKLVIAILRKILPPHVDNELAADFLRLEVGQSSAWLEWVVVRPDGLIDEHSVTEYEVHESPIRNVIFDAGKTSRINVANFMARLLADEALWVYWKGKMPVIYNRD